MSSSESIVIDATLEPVFEVATLRAEIALMRAEMSRIISDKNSLPVGWHAKAISDNTIRIDALDADGNMCYWILSTQSDT